MKLARRLSRPLKVSKDPNLPFFGWAIGEEYYLRGELEFFLPLHAPGTAKN
jgi:hypothetical protein